MHAGEGLCKLLVAGTPCIRAGLAEGIHRAVHDVRTPRAYCLVSHPKTLCHTLSEVLENDIRPVKQAPQNALPLRGLEVEQEAALCAIDVIVKRDRIAIR